MVYEFLGLLVESYGTCLLLQRLVDASKDSDIPKNVPFAFAINFEQPKHHKVIHALVHSVIKDNHTPKDPHEVFQKVLKK